MVLHSKVLVDTQADLASTFLCSVNEFLFLLQNNGTIIPGTNNLWSRNLLMDSMNFYGECTEVSILFYQFHLSCIAVNYKTLKNS